MTREQVERLLNTYSIEELLERNDQDAADAVLFLIKEGFLEVPELAPLDTEDTSGTEYLEESFEETE